MKHISIAALISAFVFISALIAAPVSTLAHDGHDAHKTQSAHDWEPKPRPPVTSPSNHYSGNTPINRDNGNFFNTGTFGAPNPDYEAWASSPTWAVSLSEKAYPFEQKDRFIESLDERIKHFELAVWNYGNVSETYSKPEGVAHAKQAAADLGPRIEKVRDAWSKAKSANKEEWDNAQINAKRAFLEIQSFYYGLHKNVMNGAAKMTAAE